MSRESQTGPTMLRVAIAVPLAFVQTSCSRLVPQKSGNVIENIPNSASGPNAPVVPPQLGLTKNQLHVVAPITLPWIDAVVVPGVMVRLLKLGQLVQSGGW